jgi:hypothetical protein
MLVRPYPNGKMPFVDSGGFRVDAVLRTTTVDNGDTDHNGEGPVLDSVASAPASRRIEAGRRRSGLRAASRAVVST